MPFPLDADSLGDIPDDAAGVAVPLMLEIRDGDFDGKLGAVLAPVNGFVRGRSALFDRIEPGLKAFRVMIGGDIVDAEIKEFLLRITQ